MNITNKQKEFFDKEGYLFFPSIFSKKEVQNLLHAVPELYEIREEYNFREKGSDVVRTNFAAHLYSEPFAKLARHPRMIGPVEDLLQEKLYMHQFKINGKMAWYNLNSTDDIAKEFSQERTFDRCIFCGNHDEIKCRMTIVFSEFETNTGPMN